MAVMVMVVVHALVVVVAHAQLVKSARLLVQRILAALAPRVVGTFAMLGTGLEALVVAAWGPLQLPCLLPQLPLPSRIFAWLC